MDVTHLAAVVWRRRWYVVAVAVATTLLAGLFATLRTARYESTAVLAITPSTEATGGLLSSSDLTTLMGTYAQTAKSSAVRGAAAEALGHPLGADIDTSVKSGTGILRITASAEDPDVAADAAGAVADAFATALDANRSIDVVVIDEPVPPSSPADPRMGLVLALGVGLGLFGGVVLALIVDRLRHAPRHGRRRRHRHRGRGPRAGFPSGPEHQAPLRDTDDAATDAFPSATHRAEPAPGAGRSRRRGDRARGRLRIVQRRRRPGRLVRPRRRRHGRRRRRPAPRAPARAVRAGRTARPVAASALAGDEATLQPTAQPNLRVLTAGPAPDGPTELLHANVASFLAELPRGRRARARSTAPRCSAATTPGWSRAAADDILIVVRRGSQPHEAIEAMDRAANTPANVLGVVLDRDRR